MDTGSPGAADSARDALALAGRTSHGGVHSPSPEGDEEDLRRLWHVDDEWDAHDPHQVTEERWTGTTTF